MKFNGLGMNMGTLSRLSDARMRSIPPENPTGEKGCGGMRYLPLLDDIASVACWYQALPAAQFPRLPPIDYLEIV